MRRYAPDGTLDAVVPLPCGRVTACAFGGADLDELFITTSRLDVPEGVDRGRRLALPLRAGRARPGRCGVRGVARFSVRITPA